MFPVVKIRMPKDLTGVQAGKLPLELLRSVGGSAQLHHMAAPAWLKMVADAKEAGIVLKPSSSADTYRTYAMQLAAFKQRYSLTDTGTGETRKFEGKTWYLKPKMACLAIPGSSNHNWGLAVDVANANGKTLEWMLKNEHLYGFSHEVQSEPWHIRLVTGDTPTPLVQAFIDAKVVA
jgi:LAS superfamily LD-carboxypeptidase LdcB